MEPVVARSAECVRKGIHEGRLRVQLKLVGNAKQKFS